MSVRLRNKFGISIEIEYYYTKEDGTKVFAITMRDENTSDSFTMTLSGGDLKMLKLMVCDALSLNGVE